MPSPVPKPDARRQRQRIAAEQSANRLPLTGRTGRPPNAPVTLGEAGQRWWRWAWSTPQATMWNKGNLEPLARRASLEDDYESAKDTEHAHSDRARLLGIMLRLDNDFGFTPAGAAKQHFVFVDDPQPLKAVAGNGSGPDKKNVTPMRNRLKGTRAD